VRSSALTTGGKKVNGSGMCGRDQKESSGVLTSNGVCRLKPLHSEGAFG